MQQQQYPIEVKRDSRENANKYWLPIYLIELNWANHRTTKWVQKIPVRFSLFFFLFSTISTDKGENVTFNQ